MEKQQQGSLGDAIDELDAKINPITERILKYTASPQTPEAVTAVQALMLERLKHVNEAAMKGSPCGHAPCQAIFVGECAKKLMAFGETLFTTCLLTVLHSVIDDMVEEKDPCKAPETLH